MHYKIRMLIIDPVGLLPAVTVNKLSQSSSVCLLGIAENWEDVITLPDTTVEAPDVILYSLLPGCSLDATFGRLAQFGQAMKSILLINDEDDPLLLPVLAKGTNGYLKSCSTTQAILQAVTQIYRGEAVLSPRIMNKILDQIQDQQV